MAELYVWSNPSLLGHIIVHMFALTVCFNMTDGHYTPWVNEQREIHNECRNKAWSLALEWLGINIAAFLSIFFKNFFFKY